ncbi:hypothetical protein TNCV_4222391 [Trichonephila clavipes]|nr:hypothetical protein TNCV_4222391 [Trichonephila clavipes]
MLARHHLSGYDLVRLEAGLHCSCCNRCIKECHLAIKKAAEDGNAMRKHVRDHGRNYTFRKSPSSPRGKKEQKFSSWPDSCKPCIHYQYASFSKNHLVVIKSSGFDALSSSFAQRTMPPCTVQELETTLRVVWDNIS